MESKIQQIIQLNQRLKTFALMIIRLYQQLPKTTEAQIIGRQLLRSGTSVSANYRAVCRARSNNEQFSKLSIVVEEADETLFWIELLEDTEILSKTTLKNIKDEALELLKIFASTRKNIKPQK